MYIHFMRLLSDGMAGHDPREGRAYRRRPARHRAARRTRPWRWRPGRVRSTTPSWPGTERPAATCPTSTTLDELGLNAPIDFCFPHYFLLPTYSSASSYRIRPLGPEECLFELWSLTRYPPGQRAARPPTPPEPMAPDDPRWPPIPAQDFSNLPKQQKGLHAKGFEYMRLSDKVEGMIGNYQRLIDGYLAGLPYEKLVPAMQKVNTTIDVPIADLGF